MDIRLNNTLTHSVETFTPLKNGVVTIYSCGPTVYDTAHVGNFRTYVMNDLLRRMFEYSDYRVIHAMNITDVDDKTIRRSLFEKIPLSELTHKYETLFLEGLASLHVMPPHHLVRATENIPEMVTLISTLLEKGVAYKAEDGIYMSISKVKDYGKLSHVKPDAERRERITNDEYDKEHPGDFALWKFKSGDDGDNSWPAPFGEGRPGWHIECSAMSMKVLGPTIDIHTGASDLVFPHHENEIAQSEAATGKPFVRYWVHGGFMTMNDEKMAKSKGNVIKLDDLKENAISPLAFRYWLMTAHYRSPVNFTLEAVRASQQALIRLLEIVSNYPAAGSASQEYLARFGDLIRNDLDMPKVIALVWELIKDQKINDADKHATLLNFDRVLGLNLASVPRQEAEKIPEEILALAEARELARGAKEWEKADALRVEIESRGFSVKDTPDGIEIHSV